MKEDLIFRKNLSGMLAIYFLITTITFAILAITNPQRNLFLYVVLQLAIALFINYLVPKILHRKINYHDRIGFGMITTCYFILLILGAFVLFILSWYIMPDADWSLFENIDESFFERHSLPLMVQGSFTARCSDCYFILKKRIRALEENQEWA